MIVWWVSYGHGTHDFVATVFEFFLLDPDVLSVTEGANPDFLVSIAWHVVSDVGAGVTDQLAALATVMTSSEHAKGLQADGTVGLLRVWHPPWGFNDHLTFKQRTLSMLKKLDLLSVSVWHCFEEIMG